MKFFHSFRVILLIISVILLFFSFTCTKCSIVSALIALLVALYEIKKSNNLENKLNSYDNALHTKYDDKGNIKEMTYDCGTY